jgi:hypothetical protein
MTLVIRTTLQVSDSGPGLDGACDVSGGVLGVRARRLSGWRQWTHQGARSRPTWEWKNSQRQLLA